MKKAQGRNRKYTARYAAFGIWMMIVAVFCSVIQVRAVDANVFLQGYRAFEGKVAVYCTNLTALEGYGTQQFTATVSGQECPVLEVSTVKQAKEGVTYYCLVDVSGSMHQDQMEKAKDVLTEICNRLEENDNMVVGAIGTTLETTGFLTDKEEIGRVIEGLVGESDYTAIYDAIVDSISVLQSSNSCNKKKCLVLISDGDDETVLGTTRVEAVTSVISSKIPVYTVAVMRQSPNAKQKEAAENLGAFARQSVGGRDYPQIGGNDSATLEEFNAKEAGGVIVEDMQNGVILTIDTSGIAAEKDEMLLNISFMTDTDTYSDTMYLYAADLKTADDKNTEAIPEPDTGGMVPTEDNTSSAEENTSPTEDDTSPISDIDDLTLPEEDQGGISTYVIAGIVAVLVILAAVIFICMRNKAKKEAAQKEEAEREAEEREKVERKAREEEAKRKSDVTVFRQAPAPPQSCYEVKFTAINHENIVFVLDIPEGKTVTIGRNKKADLVLNPEDKHLSSVQCKVYCMQNAINVWDMNSQNGTYVNGVPIKQIGMATVQNSDVIRMGSYEYRINIMKK